jgi:hypothetical protein
MELAAAGILTPPGGLTSTASNYPCGLHRMLSINPPQRSIIKDHTSKSDPSVYRLMNFWADADCALPQGGIQNSGKSYPRPAELDRYVANGRIDVAAAEPISAILGRGQPAICI